MAGALARIQATRPLPSAVVVTASHPPRRRTTDITEREPNRVRAATVVSPEPFGFA
jgi:hypothetical protein